MDVDRFMTYTGPIVGSVLALSKIDFPDDGD